MDGKPGDVAERNSRVAVPARVGEPTLVNVDVAATAIGGGELRSVETQVEMAAGTTGSLMLSQ
jgi:hypothetical protein